MDFDKIWIVGVVVVAAVIMTWASFKWTDYREQKKKEQQKEIETPVEMYGGGGEKKSA